MDAAFIQARIDATKLQIVAYEDAVTALVGGVESYMLDTGQSVQKVTHHNLSALNKQIDALTNRCIIYGYRLNGGNASQQRPAF